LAIVGDPAYGKDAAKMTHLCSGDAKECYHRLKTMTASKKFKEDEEKKKLADGDGDGGDSDGQGTGIKSKLKIHNADEGITQLEQIPYIKKMLASIGRIKSEIIKIKTGSVLHSHDGKMGRWINVQNMDVFVAENQSIKEAMLQQCGCTKLAATKPEGKISQEKSNYHKTDSMEINCRSCRFYHEDTKYCEVVKGTIEPYYVSDLWQPKK